jgi:hypothetical protein
MISLRKTATALVVSFAAQLLFSAEASANGRFPRAQRLLESPTDSKRLYVSATFGLLLTEDHVQNWHFVCESAFAFQSFYMGDPLLSRRGTAPLWLALVPWAFAVRRVRRCAS